MLQMYNLHLVPVVCFVSIMDLSGENCPMQATTATNNWPGTNTELCIHLPCCHSDADARTLAEYQISLITFGCLIIVSCKM